MTVSYIDLDGTYIPAATDKHGRAIEDVMSDQTFEAVLHGLYRAAACPVTCYPTFRHYARDRGLYLSDVAFYEAYGYDFGLWAAAHYMTFSEFKEWAYQIVKEKGVKQ